MNSSIGHFNSLGERLRAENTVTDNSDPYGRDGLGMSSGIPVTLYDTFVLPSFITVADQTILHDEMQRVVSLIYCMLANGAGIYEIQQRLMGLE